MLESLQLLFDNKAIKDGDVEELKKFFKGNRIFGFGFGLLASVFL